MAIANTVWLAYSNDIKHIGRERQVRRDDSDFGVIASRLGYQLHRLDVLMMGSLFDETAALGLTPVRATTLAFIALHPGCDQSELARALGINRASAMATVNALVALGAVERHAGRDRRSNALHLTETGLRLRDEFLQVSAEHDDRTFGALSADERAEFGRLIHKLRTTNAPASRHVAEEGRAKLRRVK